MTLILAVVNRAGVHQSSDYRLSEVRARGLLKYRDDEAGSKQLTASGVMWFAQISFTGLASVGGRKTRDIVDEVVGKFPKYLDPGLLVPKLATALDSVLSHRDVQTLSNSDRALTIVLTLARARRVPEIVVISNSCLPNGRARTIPTRSMQSFAFSGKRGRFLLFGYTRPVTRQHRRRLRHLATGRESNVSTQKSLAAINEQVANASKGVGLISPGCWTISLDRNMKTSSMNHGSVPGEDLGLGGIYIAREQRARIAQAVLKKSKGAALVQAAGGGAFLFGPDLGTASGPERELRIRVPAMRLDVYGHGRQRPFGTIVLEFIDTVVPIRSGRWIEIPVMALALDVPPQGYSHPDMEQRWIVIESTPVINAVHLPAWNYAAHLQRTEKTYRMSFEQTWTVIRPTDNKRTARLLDADEELIVVFPFKRREITWTDDGAGGQSASLTLAAACQLQKRSTLPQPPSPLPRATYLNLIAS
jgi:hypothetical protein